MGTCLRVGKPFRKKNQPPPPRSTQPGHPSVDLHCMSRFTLDELSKTVTAEMAAVATDIWTSISNEPYISLTWSYITSDWQLVCRTLSNEPIEEHHTQADKYMSTLYKHYWNGNLICLLRVCHSRLIDILFITCEVICFQQWVFCVYVCQNDNSWTLKDIITKYSSHDGSDVRSFYVVYIRIH